MHFSTCSLLRLTAALALPLSCGLHAQDQTPAVESTDAAAPAAPEKTFAQELEAAGIKSTTGPADVQLGDVAKLSLPANYTFIGKDSVARFFEVTHNMAGGNELGVVISDEGWSLFFDFDPVGYVKDDDKDKLDAPKLMESMVENQASANEARKERGWDEMRMKGWATEPHYDPATHNLKWAFNLSSSSDNYESVWINENIRLLGRTGVMNVTLVANPESFAAAESIADNLLAGGFGYVEGERYSEFKPGDKIAEYGLAALVLGGAGAVALKTGLLAKLGLFLAKAWKFVAIAAVAGFSFIKRAWNKITGRHPTTGE